MVGAARIRLGENDDSYLSSSSVDAYHHHPEVRLRLIVYLACLVRVAIIAGFPRIEGSARHDNKKVTAALLTVFVELRKGRADAIRTL